MSSPRERWEAAQRFMAARGWYGLAADGIAGNGTLGGVEAMMQRIAVLEAQIAARPAPVAGPPAGDDLARLLAEQPHARRKIEEIIVHCTATPEGREVSVDTIRGWHKARGWDDIGYHYVVHLDGTVEAGRPEAKVGAHVSGRNTGTLGIVYVGGVDADDLARAEDTRTPEQKAALMALCRALVAKYPTITRISGHNEYAAKACPSFNVQTDPLGSILK